MGVSQLEYSDQAYFSECLQDQQDLWVPVCLKRCISITQDDTYPDNPPKITYALIHFAADIREASLQEVAHSGGMLITGDNVIWCRQELRGPNDAAGGKFDPTSVADMLVIHNVLWGILGQPLRGYLKDGNPIGFQAYIRRQRGGFMFNTETGFDDQLKVRD